MSNPDAKKRAASMRHHSAILQGRREQYYALMLCRSAARLRHHALHRFQDNEKSKVYWKQNIQKISVTRKARYFVTEPKTDKKQLYVQNLQNSIASKSALKKSFFMPSKPLTAKIKETS